MVYVFFTRLPLASFSGKNQKAWPEFSMSTPAWLKSFGLYASSLKRASTLKPNALLGSGLKLPSAFCVFDLLLCGRKHWPSSMLCVKMLVVLLGGFDPL